MKIFLLLLAVMAVHGYAQRIIFSPEWEKKRPNIISRSNIPDMPNNFKSPYPRRYNKVDFVSRERVEQAMNIFAINLYKTMDTKAGNSVVSPYSAYLALAMATYGAAGKTRRELLNVLRLPKETSPNVISQTKQFLGEVQDRFMFAGPKLPFYVTANMVIVNDSISLKPDYRNVVESTFKSSLVSANFGNPQQAANTINNKISELSHKFVEKVVDEEAFSEDPSVLIMNTVFFYGLWEKQFPVEDTTDRDFYVNDQIVKSVPTMAIEEEFEVGELSRLDAKFVVLPYKNTRNPEDAAYMYLILPNKRNGLATLQKQINYGTLKELQKTQLYSTTIMLPKFKIEQQSSLTQNLINMGVAWAFSKGANFTGITADMDLYISSVSQQTSLTVNEAGTLGQSTTSIGFSWRIGGGSIYRFDHPFLVIVATKKVILFTANVVDPSQL
ncbi:antichymotrypsin-2-like isoform X2 [Diachasmimorpha longicaudata]